MIFPFFKKYLKRKLFNRIFLIYSLIIILSILVLTVFITGSMTQTLKQKELNSNMQLLGSISSYFDQKYYSSMSMMQQIYANNDASSDLIYFLKHDFSDYIANRLDIFSSSTSSTLTNYQTFLNAFFIRDKDIESIVLYSSKKDFFYVFGDRNGPSLYEYGEDTRKLIGSLTASHRQYYPVLLAGSPLSPEHQEVYSTISSINDPDTLERIGSLIINYNLDGIQSVLRKFPGEVKGYCLILTKNGEVLYDSSGRYTNGVYPYAGMLVSSSAARDLGEKAFSNVIVSPDSGAVIAGIIPQAQITASTAKTRSTIILISFVLIFASLAVTYLIIHVFSKRTEVIMQGMEALRGGNLAARIPVGRNEDELSQIAVNFNDMCDSLNDYINKVYLSEIKQKNSELMALQSQINPHFLYNTLEAIRMKAVSAGSANVGEMIYILATLFRNSIKGETFIPVSAELEHCTLYLRLFRIRYEGRLAFEINVPESLMNYTIVKFTLQPIIENYILHGFRQDSSENRIQVGAELKECDIHFTIRDNGSGIEPERLAALKKSLEEENGQHSAVSIGLPNVNERLRILYGSKYGLDLSSEPDKGTTVEIRIPAKRREELEEYVQGVFGG
jgi:two-component system sensor histidine kinase YesM